MSRPKVPPKSQRGGEPPGGVVSAAPSSVTPRRNDPVLPDDADRGAGRKLHFAGTARHAEQGLQRIEEGGRFGGRELPAPPPKAAGLTK